MSPPQAPPSAPEDGADPPPGASGGQGETVLVVEDEELLRDLLARILEDAGYRPLCAPHADEAIALVDGGERPRVLVTDVVMPGMDGRELARRLLVQVDGLAVIYMSGYVRRESHAEAELAPGTPFLNKPFAPDSLLEHVAAALQAEA